MLAGSGWTHSRAGPIGIRLVENTALRPICPTSKTLQLAQTLRQRGKLRADSLLEMVDTNPVARFQPLKENIQRELPGWLKQAGPADQVLVFFSGHGFRDSQGQLYLAGLDCDPRDPAAGGVPVAWLRDQLAACPAKVKLLIIDACHAGSEKGGPDPTRSRRRTWAPRSSRPGHRGGEVMPSCEIPAGQYRQADRYRIIYNPSIYNPLVNSHWL